MKVKLFKIYSSRKTIEFNYGDDSTDIIRHLVENFCDWEDVELDEFARLRDWVKENRGYVLASESDLTCRQTIKQIIKQAEIDREKYKKEEEHEIDREKYKKEEEQRKQKAELEKAKRKEKELERLQKRLAKVKQQINEKNQTPNVT